MHSLALTGLVWVACAIPAAGLAADTDHQPGREAALRMAARLRGDIAALRTRWQGLRASPSAERCREHVAAVERVEGSFGQLADALDGLALELGRVEAHARAATSGAADCRHQQRLARTHARAAAGLCDALPTVASVATTSPTAETGIATCGRGVSFAWDAGVVFASGPETEAWLGAGGGRTALGALERAFEGLPEIVVVRFDGRRLGAEGLRASVRLTENQTDAREGAPGAPMHTRVVVLVGAEDPAAETVINFAAAWAFVPTVLPPACRPGAADAWWFAEGASVLSFGRRGYIVRHPEGAAEWRAAAAAGDPEAEADPLRSTLAFSPGERALMGLAPTESDLADRGRGVRWLAGATTSPNGVAHSSVLCEASAPVLSRTPGIGPSIRLVVASETPLSPQARRDHLAWWRAYSAADRDARPEVANFFEATGERARPLVDGELAPRRACSPLPADLP
ncbi:hypothetical protein L6V77_13685 [Myxococcota bacterium]|nr:hypothetical protein [Myxococcota bacterium]